MTPVSQVGLPARGKSYLSNKLMIYLKVRYYFPCRACLTCSLVARIRREGSCHLFRRCILDQSTCRQVFNVGQLRRTRAKQKELQYVYSTL